MSGLSIGIGVGLSFSFRINIGKGNNPPSPPIEVTDTILLENGDGFFLTEDGGYILLEEEPAKTINKSYWNF